MKCKLSTFMLVVAVGAQAQDASFTYQGILKHDGFAAYGTYDFEFALYQFQTGGVPLAAPNVRNGLDVSNGLFTVVLDFGSVFNADSRWLQISVKTNADPNPYTVLAPRQELTPTPHALYAHNAARASAVPWLGLESLPGGFADGVDNDTTYTAGTGLTLNGTMFSLHQAFTDTLYWRLGGNNVAPGQFLGTVNDQALELRANNVRALRLEPGNGLPNVIGGSLLNSVPPGVGAGTIGGGDRNTIGTNYATIGGGRANAASGAASVIAGGAENLAGAHHATVGGGLANTNHGAQSVINGGFKNTIVANTTNATIGGGSYNWIDADADCATIGGGTLNEVHSSQSVVGGGSVNRIEQEAWMATIAGGNQNEILSRAITATIGGGGANVINPLGSFAVIAGGLPNSIGISSFESVIGGGVSNAVLDLSRFATLGGGASNIVSSNYTTISGGRQNLVRAEYGAIPGGFSNEVAAKFSFAAGHRAKANHEGSFVWADNTEEQFSSTTNKQFAVRANNGVMIQAGNTALDVRGGGAVRVEGAGIGTSTPVFIHRATAANVSGHTTAIDHPHCNNDPNAILIVTPNWNPGGAGGVYNNSPIGLFYSSGRWRIFNQDIVTPITINAAFNVLVVKP